MTIAIQAGFWGNNSFIGDTRQKLHHLHENKPDVFTQEMRLYFEYWCEYDGLEDVLEDKLEAFRNWMTRKATPSNTISRSYRDLKKDGVIPQTDEEQERRHEQESTWQTYFNNKKELVVNNVR